LSAGVEAASATAVPRRVARSVARRRSTAYVHIWTRVALAMVTDSSRLGGFVVG
jgi:hypothetical protein